MPKSQTPRIAEAQRQRKNISKKGEKYAPSVVYLQVIGSGARGAPNTLYMFTDQKRYLFNCGESTQRLAHEHKVKLSRLNHIFITNKSWKNIGGLPGLSLTLQDVGVPSITLHGPKGLDELYTATKRFVIMKNMEVKMAACSPTKDFEDSVMSVHYIHLGRHDSVLDVKGGKHPAKKQKLNEFENDEYKEFMMDDTDYYNPKAGHAAPAPAPAAAHKKDVKDVKGLKPNQPKPDFYEKTLYNYSERAVAYVCTLKKRLGTLNLEKCVELGVPPGPLLGQLKTGRDVVLADGRLIFASEVKTPDEPGPVFIVIEVPDISYLEPIEFNIYFDNKDNPPENIPALVVHFTPPEVVAMPQYQEFMSMFGPKTRHLMLNTSNSCLGSEAVHRTQHRLHLLDGDIFPLLRDTSIPTVWQAHSPPERPDDIRQKVWEELKNKIAMAQFQSIIEIASNISELHAPPGQAGPRKPAAPIEPRTLSVFHLRPKIELDRSMEPKLHIQDYIREAMDADGFAHSLEQFRLVAEVCKSAVTSEYPRVVFLGTGSCIPSKTRNTSAIVVQIDEQHSILLDCGEGTFGQLVRFYSPKRVNRLLRTLKGIYVSHLHADHHIGLISILQERRAAFLEANMDPHQHPVYLLAPGQIMSWLAVYDQKFEQIRGDFTLVPNQSLLSDADGDSGFAPSLAAQLGLSAVRTCLVSHCPNAFGVALVADDHKITYSGDTLPCEDLVKLGKGSTLLIHEATMEDDLHAEARLKMHSTTTQAINVGKKMEAGYIILTHFSQRYARLPRLNANILHGNRNVGIAFDNMVVTMSNLDLLPHMYAPLQLMFAEHCLEMEVKATHRALQAARDARKASRDTVKNVRFEDVDEELKQNSRGVKNFILQNDTKYDAQWKTCRNTTSSMRICPSAARHELEVSPNSQSRSSIVLCKNKVLPLPSPSIPAKASEIKEHSPVLSARPSVTNNVNILATKRSPTKVITTSNSIDSPTTNKDQGEKTLLIHSKHQLESVESSTLLSTLPSSNRSSIKVRGSISVFKPHEDISSKIHKDQGDNRPPIPATHISTSDSESTPWSALADSAHTTTSMSPLSMPLAPRPPPPPPPELTNEKRPEKQKLPSSSVATSKRYEISSTKTSDLLRKNIRKSLIPQPVYKTCQRKIKEESSSTRSSARAAGAAYNSESRSSLLVRDRRSPLEEYKKKYQSLEYQRQASAFQNLTKLKV